MMRLSIRRRIVLIVVGLTILMVATSVLSMVMVGRVGRLLDELKARYNPVNAHLTRIETLSLERALTLRRLVIATMQDPPDEEGFTARKQLFDAKAAEVNQEAQSARQLINEMIADPSVSSDKVGLARIESRIESLMSDGRLLLTQANDALFAALDARNFAEVATLLTRVDLLRDELSQRIDALREAMAGESDHAIETIKAQQSEAVVISAIATFLAALVGLIFANLVSGGIVRSVRKLLDGTRAIEAGHLDQSIEVTTRDEIGELSAAFNRMIVQLRVNRRVKETFGKYIDPRVVEGLIDHPNMTAAEGQRRLMAVMFCDLKGFTTLSEGLVPQGLVRVMNRYFSLMSDPIRANGGIIDKYVGDGIMAYWGPPFVGEGDHSRLACHASLEMIERINTLRQEIPEILGVRDTPMENCDLKIGVATGEALVGSIGSEIMMSYTVMGDVVNLASRLEGANRLYGTRNLVSGKTIAAAGQAFEVREVDSIVVEGQTRAQGIFEILGRRGEVTTERLASRDCYEVGLAAYRHRRWEDAASAFRSSLAAMPDDGPSLTMLARMGTDTTHLSADWDGSWCIAK